MTNVDAKLDELLAELEKLNASVDSLKNEVIGVREELHGVRAELDSLAARLTTVEQHLDSTANRLASAGYYSGQTEVRYLAESKAYEFRRRPVFVATEAYGVPARRVRHGYSG